MEVNRRGFLAAAGAMALVGCRTAGFTGAPRVTTFGSYIASGARQRGIELKAAAALMLKAGIAGFDESYRDDRLIESLKSMGLTPVSLYGEVNFFDVAKAPRTTEAFIAAAVRHGSPRVMVIPAAFPKGCDRYRQLDAIAAGLERMALDAQTAGVTVTVEDFGSPDSPCSRIAYMKHIFAGAPHVRFTLDSGNFHYAGNGHGDDILDALSLFSGRIEHVHLKDYSNATPRRYVPLGKGDIPNRTIVEKVRANGYDGCYTLEECGAPDYLSALAAAAAQLRGWCVQG